MKILFSSITAFLLGICQTLFASDIPFILKASHALEDYDNHNNPFYRDFSFSPDGNLLGISTNGDTAHVYDTFNGQLITEISTHDDDGMQKMFFSHDNGKVATRMIFGDRLFVFDINSGNRLFTISEDGRNRNAFQGVWFSPDDANILTHVSNDRKSNSLLRLRDATTGYALDEIDIGLPILNCAYPSPNEVIIFAQEAMNGSNKRSILVHRIPVLDGQFDKENISTISTSLYTDIEEAWFNDDATKVTTLNSNGLISIYEVDDLSRIFTYMLGAKDEIDDALEYMQIKEQLEEDHFFYKDINDFFSFGGFNNSLILTKDFLWTFAIWNPNTKKLLGTIPDEITKKYETIMLNPRHNQLAVIDPVNAERKIQLYDILFFLNDQELSLFDIVLKSYLNQYFANLDDASLASYEDFISQPSLNQIIDDETGEKNLVTSDIIENYLISKKDPNVLEFLKSLFSDFPF